MIGRLRPARLRSRRVPRARCRGASGLPRRRYRARLPGGPAPRQKLAFRREHAYESQTLGVGHIETHKSSGKRRVEFQPSPVFSTIASVLRDPRIDQLPKMGFEPFTGAFFIRSDEPRIASNIGCEDRGETAGLAHVSRQPALRRPSTKWA
jgi:hypothetical protein